MLGVTPPERPAPGGGSRKVWGRHGSVGGLSWPTQDTAILGMHRQGRVCAPPRMSPRGGGGVHSCPGRSAPTRQGTSQRALAENKISLDLGAPHLGSGVDGSRNCLAGTSCLVAGVSVSDLRGHLSRPETGGSGGAQGTKILIPSPQGLESKEQGHVFKFFLV